MEFIGLIGVSEIWVNNWNKYRWNALEPLSLQGYRAGLYVPFLWKAIFGGVFLKIAGHAIDYN
jgi:hypothetical protein